MKSSVSARKMLFIILVSIIVLSLMTTIAYSRNEVKMFRCIVYNKCTPPFPRYDVDFNIEASKYVGAYLGYYQQYFNMYIKTAALTIDGKTSNINNQYEYVSWYIHDLTKATILASIKHSKIVNLVEEVSIVKPIKDPFSGRLIEKGYLYIIAYDLQGNKQVIGPWDIPYVYKTNFPDETPTALVVVYHPISGYMNTKEYDDLATAFIAKGVRVYVGFNDGKILQELLSGNGQSYLYDLPPRLKVLLEFMYQFYSYVSIGYNVYTAVKKAANDIKLSTIGMGYVVVGVKDLKLVKTW